MVKWWLWGRKTQPKPDEQKQLACPSCRDWAPKEVLDRERVTPAHEQLACECGAKHLSLAWREAGRTKRMLEQARKQAAYFEDRANQFGKPPQSN